MASRSKKKRRHQAWVGGIVETPADVTIAGMSARTESILWVDSDGQMVGVATFDHGEASAAFAEAFVAATEAPLVGRPGMPTRVRVATPELAAALKAVVGDRVEVACAPTPEMDVIASVINGPLEEE